MLSFFKVMLTLLMQLFKEAEKSLPAAKEGTRALPFTGSAGLLCLLVLGHSGQKLAPAPRQVPLIKKSIPEQPAAAEGSSHFILSANTVRGRTYKCKKFNKHYLELK